MIARRAAEEAETAALARARTMCANTTQPFAVAVSKVTPSSAHV